MKRILAIATFLPCVALAQAQPDPRVAQETVNEIVNGRNNAIAALMTDQAALRAELIVLRKDLEAAKKAAEVCKPEEKK